MRFLISGSQVRILPGVPERNYMIQIKNVLNFIWIEIIKSITITLFIRNPCKSSKCLVKACCTKICGERRYYLKYCDNDQRIVFQRFCAVAVWFGIISLLLTLIKAAVES